MAWVMLYVVLGVAGILVLGVCAFKVFTALRGLAGELDRVRGQLEPKGMALQRELEGLRRSGE